MVADGQYRSTSSVRVTLNDGDYKKPWSAATCSTLLDKMHEEGVGHDYTLPGAVLEQVVRQLLQHLEKEGGPYR